MAWIPFLTARWRQLLMLNYVVEPELLAPLAPRGTRLDGFGGQTYISLVGFEFLDTRVLGMPIPGYRSFPEVNLRFYVVRDVAGTSRRGVVFVKEIVPRRAVSLVARRMYNENYVTLPMRSAGWVGDRSPDAGESVAYEFCHRGAWCSLTGVVASALAPPPPDSEAAFIVEHYWGYGRHRGGATLEYRVNHPPWRVAAVQSATFRGPVADLYGLPFDAILNSPPVSALIADGSAIAVDWPRHIE